MAKKILSDSPPAQARPLSLLSVVIPARDEEGCICSTVEHLHLELRLHNIPHEIVVVDDGSTDGTWKQLTDLQTRLPELAPVKNEGLARLRPGRHLRARPHEGRRGGHHDGR